MRNPQEGSENVYFEKRERQEEMIRKGPRQFCTKSINPIALPHAVAYRKENHSPPTESSTNNLLGSHPHCRRDDNFQLLRKDDVHSMPSFNNTATVSVTLHMRPHPRSAGSSNHNDDQSYHIDENGFDSTAAVAIAAMVPPSMEAPPATMEIAAVLSSRTHWRPRECGRWTTVFPSRRWWRLWIVSGRGQGKRSLRKEEEPLVDAAPLCPHKKRHWHGRRCCSVLPRGDR